MRTVITYDIGNDQARNRVAKVLLDYAKRVQKSVFEAPALPRAAYLRLRSRAERLIDPRTDSLRYYPLCTSCAARIEHHGAGPGYLDVPPEVEVL